MSAKGAAVVRPRTTGELLDDAWRLYFADAPALLLLSGAFLAPAFGALVLLAGLPAPANPVLRLLTPLLPLTLLVLTGIGSGACQEWLRARAEDRPPSFAECLTAAFRRGLSHAAARAVALVGPLLGLGIWLSAVAATEKSGGSADADQLLGRLLLTAVACLPGLLLWPLLATVHAFLASGQTRSLADLGEYLRLARYDAGKTGAVTLSRVAVLVLAVVNLQLLVEVGLWVLRDLAGFDAAFVALQLTAANPVYNLALVLFAWLLLAPFFETSNFLTLVDARTRQEGLDLQVRVQRAFPTAERRRVGALAVLAGLLFLGAVPARANTEYDAVHAARLDVERIAKEAKAADPYNGAHEQIELDQTATALEKVGGRGRFDWFDKAIDRFARRPKDDALRVLGELDDRLALLEETLPHDDGEKKAPSRDDLQGMLQQPGASRPVVDVPPEEDAPKPKDKKHDDDTDQPNDQGDGQPQSAPPTMGTVPAGCGQTGLMVLGGLALAVLLVGAGLFLASRNKGPRPARAPLVSARSVQQTTERQGPPPHERPAEELWREADAQARDGQHLEAVRSLYLAVLSMLHRKQLVRFEPTRTNGEYVQQVRLAPQAPAALHTAFQEFTSLFERKWYGDRMADAAEFRAARGLAEQVRTLVQET